MTLTTITRSKPFYVAAGVTDAAVAKLRGVPAKLSTVKVERRDIEKAVATVQIEVVSLPARAQATPSASPVTSPAGSTTSTATCWSAAARSSAGSAGRSRPRT
jgi:hypothetical protein